MKFACQEGLAPGATFAEKLDKLAEAGFTGVELGGSGLADRAAEIKQAAERHSVKPSSICAGFRGCPLDADRKEREMASADIISLLRTGGELGVRGLIMVPIFGPPRLPDLHPLASPLQLENDLLLKLCDTWAQAAAESGTLLLLEPLNRYETHIFNRVEQAAEICRRVGNPAMKVMADFFHMSIEEADIPGAIRAHSDVIAHVHLADSNRLLPGLGHTDFRSGFRALAEARYDGYMALECGNPNPDKLAGLKASVEFMKAQLS